MYYISSKHLRVSHATLRTSGIGSNGSARHSKLLQSHPVHLSQALVGSWFSPSWAHIEEASLSHSTKQVLAALLLQANPPHSFLTTVKATTKLWMAILQQAQGLSKQALILLPLSTTELNYIKAGINTIGYLFYKGELYSFQDLHGKYNIANRDVYKYLQIGHALISDQWSDSSMPQTLYVLMSNHHHPTKESLTFIGYWSPLQARRSCPQCWNGNKILISKRT